MAARRLLLDDKDRADSQYSGLQHHPQYFRDRGQRADDVAGGELIAEILLIHGRPFLGKAAAEIRGQRISAQNGRTITSAFSKGAFKKSVAEAKSP